MEMVVVVAGVSSRSRAARAEDAVKKAVGGRLRVKKKGCYVGAHGIVRVSWIVATVRGRMTNNASIGESSCYRLNVCARIDAI